MLRRSWNKNNQAQIFLEYAIITSVVLVVLITMNTLIKRSIQGMIKSVADQVGLQMNAEQRFDDSGHLERQYTSTRSALDKTTRDFLGVTNYIYADVTWTNSSSFINLGFTPEN